MASTFHEELLRAVEPEWTRMLAHPFLEKTANGTIEQQAFHRWLVQDFHYARELLRVMGILLARVPHEMVWLLVDGFTAMKSELGLFEREARARGVDLKVDMAPTCLDYISFLQATTARADLVEAWAAFYAQEQAYLDCWRRVKSDQKGASPYQSFIDNWTSDGFAGYVAALAAALDRLAQGIATTQRAHVERTLRRVVDYEHRFWSLSEA